MDIWDIDIIVLDLEYCICFQWFGRYMKEVHFYINLDSPCIDEFLNVLSGAQCANINPLCVFVITALKAGALSTMLFQKYLSYCKLVYTLKSAITN